VPAPPWGRGLTLDAPYSFFLTVSYYGIVLDLQNLGSNIFLPQVLFGAVDLLAWAITTFLLRFFGRRTTLAGSLAGAGLAVLANTLVPQGAIRAAELGAEGPRGCRPPPHRPRSAQDPDCHSSTHPPPISL